LQTFAGSQPATAKSETAWPAEKALLESFQQPVCVFLSDGPIIHSLLDALTNLSITGRLDGCLDVSILYALLLGDLFESFAALKFSDQLVGGHIEGFRCGLQAGQPESASAARTASMHQSAGRTLCVCARCSDYDCHQQRDQQSADQNGHFVFHGFQLLFLIDWSTSSLHKSYPGPVMKL
jgi:hypothetical protein